MFTTLRTKFNCKQLSWAGRPRCIALSAALLMLQACSEPVSNESDSVNPQTEQIPGIELRVPRAIIETRNVDLSQLRAEVTLSDGRSIPMTSNGTEWVGTIDVVANSQLQINIIWIEFYDNRDLPLAELARTVDVGDTAFALSIGPTEYLTNLDEDRDGVTNLDERNALSDPFDGTSGGGTNPNSRVSVIVPRISSNNAPVIDGLGAAYDPTELRLVGEWANAAQQGAFAGADLFVDSLMINKGNINIESNPFHRWAAAHDGTYLYILVLVDDIGQHQSDSPGSLMWNDDSVEIFTDGNNSKFDSYGDGDDRYFILPLQQFNSPSANISSQPNSRIAQGFQVAPVPASIEFATGVGTGPLSLRSSTERQDVYEIKIPLSELGISIGSPFGIEIQINDDDDGGDRDSKWGWVHPARTDTDTDMTWQNPSFMGTGELGN